MPRSKKDPAAVALGRKGGRATAAKLSPEERRENATAAGRARWEKMTTEERAELVRKMIAKSPRCRKGARRKKKRAK